MTKAHCTAWLAWKFWQICDNIQAPSVQPAFFVVPACQLIVLDWFEWHHQASVHCSKQGRHLISATSNYSDIRKILGRWRIEPWAASCEARMLSIALCTSPQQPALVCFSLGGQPYIMSFGCLHAFSIHLMVPKRLVATKCGPIEDNYE